MTNPDLKALVEVVTALQRQVNYLSKAVAHLAPINNHEAQGAVMSLSSSEFMVEVPKKIDELRAQVGLFRIMVD